VLQRDYVNVFDEHAIAVLIKTGEQIGFVPRHVAFRHPAMNDLAPHMDQGGAATAKIVGIIGGECEIEIEVIGSDGEKPYQLKEAAARELRDKAKTLEKVDPKEAIRLYRKSLVTMLEVDNLIRETNYFKKQIAELGYDLGTWRRASLPIERITALLEKAKNYSECLAEIDDYEKIEDRNGLSQNDLRKIRERKRRVTRIIKPEKTINTGLLAGQIETLQANPNRFHEKYLTFHSYDYSTGLVSHYREEIKHLGLGASSILQEFEKDKLTNKVNDQLRKWDEEWLLYLQQDLADGIKAEGSINNCPTGRLGSACGWDKDRAQVMEIDKMNDHPIFCSDGDDQRKKLYKIFSENLNSIRNEDFIQIESDIPDSYICPLCTRHFTIIDIDKARSNCLTLEDVPPKSLGGKPLTLTCKECNNTAGSLLDEELRKKLITHEFIEGVTGAIVDAKIRLDEELSIYGTLSHRHSGGLDVHLYRNGPKAAPQKSQCELPQNKCYREHGF
jgi:hypothetical protein